METPKTPEVTSKSTEPMFGVLSENVRPEVRAYFENLIAQVKDLFRAYGAKNSRDFEERTRSGEIPIPTSDLRHINGLIRQLDEMRRTEKFPKEATATSPNEITADTLIYKGIITPEVIAKLPKSIEHIFTPEGKDLMVKLEIGGKDENELEELLEREGHKITSTAKSMMENDDFKRSLREEDPKQPDWKKWKLKSPEEAKLIRLSVKDLGLPDGATTDQIFARAEELGLELCPPEVGPRFRLQYVNQPMNGYVYVGMKQITGQDGYPNVFLVARYDDGSWLNGNWAEPGDEWDARSGFVFRLRKSET